jgi:transcription elongation GreA/GreB family factor
MEAEVVAPATTPLAAAVTGLEELGVTIDGDDPLEVEIGDRVTYFNLAQEKEATIIVGTQTDMTRGTIDYRTPLADTLLGCKRASLRCLQYPEGKQLG